MTQIGGAMPGLNTSAAAIPAMIITGQEQWFAIQTLPRHEKRVVQYLGEKGITNFLPIIPSLRFWSDRRKIVEAPLFPGYAFVNVDPCVEKRVSVLRTPGVVRFIGAGHEPVPIPERQILDVQTLLLGGAVCAPHPFLKIGQRMRIRGGAFDGVEGILLGRNADLSLVISIDLIQRSVKVTISGFDVEPI
ncbi:MAG TPA: UpxY family transcription antiterminator [Terriglobales bacterium]|nr:UpxY family transcription antiterminator [Terriglobales bacterium]